MSAARIRSIVRPTITGIALVVLHACGNAPDPEQAADGAADHDAMGMPAAPDGADLDALRRLTTGFDDIAVARAAGYTDQITPCWYHRERGGQGIHIARSELIDGTLSLLEPELVMYEPMADGTHQFLAIEYIVPFSAWTETEPPVMLGRQLMRNERLELFVLHVWLGKDNPNGMYDDWNPNVSCEHAAESEDRA